MNAAAAARAVGLSVRGLYAQLARHGIRPRRRGVFDEEVLAALRRAQETDRNRAMSILEAAAELGCAKATMLRAMRAAGIPKPSGTRTITPHLLEEIRRAVNRHLSSPGVSGNDAARILGITRNRLWALARREHVVLTDVRAFTPAIIVALREALARDRRQQELSAKEAAARLGISTGYLHEMLREHGIAKPRGRDKFSRALVERLRGLLPDGPKRYRGSRAVVKRPAASGTMAAAAERLGVSVHTLRRLLSQHRIARPPGPFPKLLEIELGRILQERPPLGLTTVAFAQQLGLTHGVLRYRCLTLGIRLDRKWPFTPAVVAEYQRRWAQHEKRRRQEGGRTAAEVATELGCSPGHVSRMVAKHNIPKDPGPRKYTNEIVARLRDVVASQALANR